MEKLKFLHHVDQKNAIRTSLLVENYGLNRALPFKVQIVTHFSGSTH